MKKINWFSRLFMTWNQLEAYFAEQQGNKQTLDKLEEVYKSMINQSQERIQELTSELAKAKEIITRLQEQNVTKDRDLNNEKTTAAELQRKLQEVKVQLDERTSESKKIQDEIRDQLQTINRIEKTFFSSSGNKGKGELGEQQVKLILQKSGLAPEMWMENLTVGSTTVEFAMFSGQEGKFIPIDSKVLDANTDKDGKVIIDDKYKTKVKAAAKDISKYLGKQNTTEYGILVLQNDSIYMKLFEEYPTFFQDMIREFKVYINSPSSFVQTAWSISHLVNIYEKVHNDEKIYEQMVTTIQSVSRFANSLHEVHKNFNITMKHYGTIEKKSQKLIRKLDKEGKIKDIPQIEYIEED